MVALSSAMCAFFLIYFDRSCQDLGTDPNLHPLQVFKILFVMKIVVEYTEKEAIKQQLF